MAHTSSSRTTTRLVGFSVLLFSLGWAFSLNTPVQAAACSADTKADDGKYFVADSFSFGVEREMKESGEKSGSSDETSFQVEREMKESGEKGGTEDINIGVGELQECTVTKEVDR